MIKLLGRFYRLGRLCVTGPGGWIGVVQFLAILALGLIGVRIGVRLIAWNADFYNALQKLDTAEAVRQIGIYFALTALSVVIFLTANYLRKLLQIRWRRTLTEAAMDRWLAHKAYWHMRGRVDEGLDNPDQRIAEDCRIFVEKLTVEANDLITSCVALVTYMMLLWSLSTFLLAFTVAGIDVEIPRYMIWAAPIYVFFASVVTQWLGKPLTALNYQQQHREADFRFALSRLRENVEPVALAGGEAAERRLLDGRLRETLRNWRRVANRELVQGFFTRPYFQTVLTIPIFLALPAYLAGRITFGGLMQLRSAFQNVVTTLSWFIFSYRDLVTLAAAAGRLDHFLTATDEAASPQAPAMLRLGAGGLRIDGLALATPHGRRLEPVDGIAVSPGECCWLVAPSGHGKSTLVKAIAGLWPHGEGTIERPEGSFFFAAQQPYLPLGSLATTLAYPALPEAFTPDDYREALAAVGLERLWTEDDQVWITARHGLSGGEKQRLALARLHLHRPEWIVLDEATSALDIAAEAELLAGLRARLPAAAFVIIAHRAPQGIASCRTIRLAPGAFEPAAPAPAFTTDAVCPAPQPAMPA